MKRNISKNLRISKVRVLGNVLLFWLGYVAIILVVSFITSKMIVAGVWQLIAWGLVSSAGLIFLTNEINRNADVSAQQSPITQRISARLGEFSLGLLIGAASFVLHVSIIALSTGAIRFEVVSGIGATTVVIFLIRYLSTSCMEELGFRGYPLQRLENSLGPWPAVAITAVAFGLSHLLYGWDMRTIVVGVIPGGVLWGMSAVAARGLAMPIGLHAAWNFASWSAGDKADIGLLRMIVKEESVEQMQIVGTVSYLSIFGLLTLVFWLLHRRNVQRARGLDSQTARAFDCGDASRTQPAD